MDDEGTKILAKQQALIDIAEQNSKNYTLMLLIYMLIQLVGVITFGHWLKEDILPTRQTLFHVQVYYSIMSLIFLDPVSFFINVFLAAKCYKFAQHLDPQFRKNKKFMLVYGQT